MLTFEDATSKFCDFSWNFGSSPQKGKVDLYMRNDSKILIYLTLLYIFPYCIIYKITVKHEILIWLLRDFFIILNSWKSLPSFIYIKMVDKLFFFANYEFISVLLSMCLAIWKLASWRKAGMKFCSRQSGALTCLVGAKRHELQKM